jgi:hypothetical protein
LHSNAPTRARPQPAAYVPYLVLRLQTHPDFFESASVLSLMYAMIAVFFYFLPDGVRRSAFFERSAIHP